MLRVQDFDHALEPMLSICWSLVIISPRVKLYNTFSLPDELRPDRDAELPLRLSVGICIILIHKRAWKFHSVLNYPALFTINMGL
jgi:hypothetical protein